MGACAPRPGPAADSASSSSLPARSPRPGCGWIRRRRCRARLARRHTPPGRPPHPRNPPRNARCSTGCKWAHDRRTRYWRSARTQAVSICRATRNPARGTALAGAASRFAGRGSNAIEPCPVGRPETSMSSFTNDGTPEKGPASTPECTRAKHLTSTACRRGSICSTRAMAASAISSRLTSPALIAPATPTASRTPSASSRKQCTVPITCVHYLGPGDPVSASRCPSAKPLGHTTARLLSRRPRLRSEHHGRGAPRATRGWPTVLSCRRAPDLRASRRAAGAG